MRVERLLRRLALASTRAPALTIAVLACLAVAAGLLAGGLAPSVADSTLVPRSAASYRATQTDERAFGADAVVVVVREPLSELIASRDLITLSDLEACFAGEVLVPDEQLQALEPAPAGALPAFGGRRSPCGMLMRSHPVQAVYGPGTFLNRAVAAVNGQLLTLRAADAAEVAQVQRRARMLALAAGLGPQLAQSTAQQAGELERERLSQQLAKLALSAGLAGLPSIESQAFLSQIVLAPGHAAAEPRASLHYLFPTADAALIQVRLRAGLSPAQSSRAIAWIRQAAAMPRFRLRYGSGYTVTGEPVLESALATQITGSIPPLLVGAIVLMAITLAFVFRGPVRLAPLAIALAAAAITAGIAALAGATLTMASVAVAPILIGLAVDYAIQFQSRARESQAGTARGAVADAAARGGPAILTAALATAAGFLVLLLSPVPMVQGFGLLLVLGILVALLCTLTGGPAAIVLGGSALRPLRSSLRGAADILRGGAGSRARAHARPRQLLRPVGSSTRGASLPGRAARHPGRVLAVGVLLAIAGWIAAARTPVQSDITKLVPSGTVALRDLQQLERVSGSSGEIDVIVHARDVATPATIRWMSAYERQLLAREGYRRSGACATATLCPALSLPDLFTSAGGAGASADRLTRSAIDAQLSAVPRYFSQAVITADRRYAVLSFGIRLMALSEQEQVIDRMRAQLHPPPGVSAQVAGLPVLAASANAALSSPARRLLSMLAALGAVALVLALLLRGVARTLVPLAPTVLASGWSALAVFATGIPLNPMSATLGALVIAISTEFSVLLSERYVQELAGGLAPAQALARCYRSTGAAVLASGLTAIAGFAVLMLSSITMLREFGLLTVIDLAVSLCGVMLLLPAVLAVAHRGGLRDRREVRSRVRAARGPRAEAGEGTAGAA